MQFDVFGKVGVGRQRPKLEVVIDAARQYQRIRGHDDLFTQLETCCEETAYVAIMTVYGVPSKKLMGNAGRRPDLPFEKSVPLPKISRFRRRVED